MKVVYERCAGLDVHKKTVVAHRRRFTSAGTLTHETRTFGTTTSQLLNLLAWLEEWECSHCVMESTGEYWKPVYTILEGHMEIVLANAHHVKNVPGRKTDVADAAWLADLLQHGLLRGSFIPPQPQRDLRDLTRQRTNLVQARNTVVNQLHKVLEIANIRLGSVVSDITGVSARAILAALIAGTTESTTLAELARGRLQTKKAELAEALVGYVRDHHRFLLTNHLAHIDFLDEQIETFDTEIDTAIAAQKGDTAESEETETVSAAPRTGTPPLALLDTAPGISTRVAEMIIAEIGTDMSRFPSANHLAAWAGLSPGNNESAGKQRTGRIAAGPRPIRQALVQAAHGAVRNKKTYLAALYHRIAHRRGRPRAIIAVAHSLIRSVYFMLSRNEPYQDLGPTYFEERKRESVANHLLRRLESLGYHVSITQTAAPSSAPPSA